MSFYTVLMYLSKTQFFFFISLQTTVSKLNHIISQKIKNQTDNGDSLGDSLLYGYMATNMDRPHDRREIPHIYSSS